MARYGYKAQLDPHVSAYYDDDMDFSKGSFGKHPRAIAIKEPEPQYTARPAIDNDISASSERTGTGTHPEHHSSEDIASDHQRDEEVAAPVVGSYIAWTGGVE